MFGLIKPHSLNFSKLPQSVRTYSRACSTTSANVSVSVLPPAYWNVTFSSPIEQMAVTTCPECTAFRKQTFRVPRQSGDGYNAGGSSVTVHLPS